MTKVTLKNRGTGPRGVIDVNGVHHAIPVDSEQADIDLDDVTLNALNEGSEAGGDLEVTAAAAPTKRSKHDEPQERARLEK